MSWIISFTSVYVVLGLIASPNSEAREHRNRSDSGEPRVQREHSDNRERRERSKSENSHEISHDISYDADHWAKDLVHQIDEAVEKTPWKSTPPK